MTVALIAPAEVPHIESKPNSFSSNSKSLSKTPQVKAPCDPPPCNAKPIVFIVNFKNLDH